MKQKRALDLEELKQLSLEGLKYFHQFCEKNQLVYYLAYGTLLGAVRHKGFIPWDDDVDVWMPRKDYDKLIELTQSFNNEHWELLSYEKEKRYCFEWAKICNKDTIVTPSRFTNGFLYGVSLDIFPLQEVLYDGEEDAFEKNDSKYLDFKKVVDTYGIYTGGVKANLVKTLAKRLRFYKNQVVMGSLQKRFFQVFDEMKDYDTKGKYYQTFLASERKLYPKEMFGDGTTKLEYENNKFSVPDQYDTILKMIYGDYMKLPPKEQQKTHHTFAAYYKK